MGDEHATPNGAPGAPAGGGPRESRLLRWLHHMGIASVWSVGILVFLVAFAVVGAVWLSRQPAGNRLTFALANRALAQSTNLRLSARHSLLVDHGAALVEPTVEIVDSLGVRHPFVVASRARLLTSWWGLLTGRPGDLYLTLDDPVITLSRTKDGRWLLPHTRPGGRPGKGAPLSVNLIVRRGLVRTLDGGRADTLARGVDATLRAHGAGGTWDFALGRLAARFPALGLAVTRADGRARLSDGGLALERLRVRTDAGWVEARGGGPLSPAPAFDGEIEAGEWTWHAAATLLRQPRLDVAGGFAGKAHVRLAEGAWTFTDGSADVLWRDEPARVTFGGRWAGGRLQLAQSSVGWRGSTFLGGFELAPASGAWRLAGRVDGLQLAELPRVWPMPALDSLVAAGDVELGGDRHGLDGRVARGRLAWRGQAVDSLSGTWSYRAGAQAIAASARTAGGRIAAQGTIASQQLDARLSASGLEGSQVSARLWRRLGLDPAPAGRVESFEARLAGPPAGPAVQGRIQVARFERAPVSVSRASATFDGVLGKDYNLNIALAGVGAHAGPAHADSARARVVLAPERIEVPSFRAERAESVLVAHGRATHGPGGWDVSVDSLDWTAGERLALVSDGPLRFRLAPDGAIEVERARVVSSAGALSVRGHWGGDRAPSDLTLDLESLDLEELLGPVAAKNEVAGVLTGTAHLAGPARHGAWDVDLAGHDLRYRDHRAPRLAVRGNFADPAWRIDGLDLDTGRGTIHLAGQVEWAAPPPWTGTAEDWNRALARAPAWKGTLSTDTLSLGQVSEFFPAAGGWRGQLTVTADLSGRPSAPAFSLTGRLGRPGWGQATLGDFDLALDYHDDVLTVDRFAMQGPDSIGPAVKGRLPLLLGWGVPAADRLPDRPMELTVFAKDLDLGLAPLILPQIAAATGKAAVTMRITGSPKHPYATGTLVVSEGVVRPANREEVLTSVEGEIALAGDELRLERCTARQGRNGRLVARPGGVAHLKDLRISDYAFSVTATNVTAFASGDYVIELSGAFDVKNGADLGGPVPIPHITGRATVLEGVFLTNFGDPTRQAGWVGPTEQPPWTYDVQVEARNNLWWRPPDANIEGKLTDFRVVQSLDRFLLLGQVDALRGRYYFLGNQFDVKSGTLVFDAAHPLDPTVDAILTTEKSIEKASTQSPGGARETITLAVSGRATQPTVSLSSEPTALSPTEIAQLLTYGQLSSGVGGVLGQFAGTYLLNQLSREVPEFERYIGTLQLENVSDVNPLDPTAPGFEVPGTGTTTTSARALTKVGVSRYVTRDLLVRYSQIVGDVTEAQRVDYQDLAAEYRLNRLLFLQGQVTRRRGVLVTSQDQTLYNLDVRARYEY